MNFCLYKIGYANSMSTLFWSGRKFRRLLTGYSEQSLYHWATQIISASAKCGLAVKALVGITNWLGSNLTKNSFGFFVVENEVKN